MEELDEFATILANFSTTAECSPQAAYNIDYSLG